MHSQFLNKLAKEERDALCRKLHEQQGGRCFICGEVIDLDVQKYDVDHIKPLNNGGKDAETNFAITHASCNRSKQDADLQVARVLWRLKKLQEKVAEEERRCATLADVLHLEHGSCYEFHSKVENDELSYSFDEPCGGSVKRAQIFTDERSGERSCFLEVPLTYLYHDDLINPRGINSSIGQLVKEFYKGNPQLHLTLARIDNGKIKVFDGQHKAVAQILLGAKAITVRLFVEPNVNRLIETNRNAGSKLRQIAFDKSVMRQLNDVLYNERVQQYRREHNLAEDDMSFSEQKLCEYFKGENVKKYITDGIKRAIQTAEGNRLKDFIDYEGKAKTYPISYSMFDKVILSSFVNSKNVLSTPLNYRSEDGENPREIEIEQISKLLSMLADEIYIGKFNKETGIYRLEDSIAKGNDSDISPGHLIAFRMSKEEIAMAWVPYLVEVIKTYFYTIGRGSALTEGNVFQIPFPEQLWHNLRNFIVNLAALPIWQDRAMARSLFSGKKTAEYWRSVFKSGRAPDGAQVLSGPLSILEMTQD